MSSKLLSRFSIYSICGAMIMLVMNVESADAQKRTLRPPSGNNANQDDDDDDASDNPRNRRPNGRPASVGNRGGGPGGSTNARSAKPKFVNLLEDKDLSNFRGYAQQEIGEGWSIDGKYLYFDGSGGGDIITKEVYDDFDLQVDWKVADGSNSGIMYRVSLGDDAPYMSGPEYQILDDTDHQDGKVEITSAGSLYGMMAPQGEKKLRDVGSWNKTRIVVEGNKVTHYLNGTKVVEAEIGSDDWNAKLEESKFKDWEKFAKNKEGHIAFQDHGNEVWFRNVRIKRLGSSGSSDSADEDDDERAPRGGYNEDREPRGGPPSAGRSLGPPAPTSMRPQGDKRGDDDK